MHRFWDDIVKPILKEFNLINIVEIGSKGGEHTCKMIDYCYKNGGFLHCIDPNPEYDYKTLENKYHKFFKQYIDLSLNILDRLENIEVVLIDGDHNWYTVFNELKLIDGFYDEFPIVFFHDISWPYARRDLYYNPDEIPKEYRKPYEKKGILVNKSELDDNGINSHLFNATIESKDKNGVLTAIEDFIAQSNRSLNFYKFNVLNGLGILIPEEKCLKLESSKILDVAYSNLLSKSENERINYQIESSKFKNLYREEHVEYARLNVEFNKLQLSTKEKDCKIDILDTQNVEMKDRIVELNKFINSKDKVISNKNNIISNKNRVISKKNRVISNKNKTINAYSNSFSWKITKPLRKLGKTFRKVKNKH